MSILLTREEINKIWHNPSKELETETVGDAAGRVAKAQSCKILDELKRIDTYHPHSLDKAVFYEQLIEQMEEEAMDYEEKYCEHCVHSEAPCPVNSCTHKTEWMGLYQGSADLWHPDSYCHPAKMSVALCYKTFAHLKEIGLIDDNSTILDPMGGIGTTGLVAASLGMKAILVELEPKFIELQGKNKAYLEGKLNKPLDITSIQGDSRNLSGLLTERGLCCVTSPPYADTVKSDEDGIDFSKTKRDGDVSHQKHGYCDSKLRYSDNPANIGNLKDKPLVAVTSPPYEDSGHLDRPERWADKGYWKTNKTAFYTRKGDGYGQSEGQIGQEKAESYQSAMLQVYSEIIKVADVLAVVVKDPTRNKKIYPLGEITISLMESAGWHIHCVHEARLFTEESKTDLFGETTKKPKGRISFFKLLSYKKGSPVSDHEDVIIATREGKTGLCAICSPPYGEMIKKRTGGIGERESSFKDKFNMPYGTTPGNIGNLR